MIDQLDDEIAAAIQEIENKGVRLYLDGPNIGYVSPHGHLSTPDRTWVADRRAEVAAALEKRRLNFAHHTVGSRTIAFLRTAQALGTAFIDEELDRVPEGGGLARWAAAEFGLEEELINNFLLASRSAAIRNNLVDTLTRTDAERFPLSMTQESWWRIWIDTDSHATIRLVLDFPLNDAAKIAPSVLALLEDTPILRSRVQQDESGPFVKLNTTTSFCIDRIEPHQDVSAGPAWLSAHIDMRSEWLFRACVHHLPQGIKLHLAISHLICDGISIRIIATRLKELIHPGQRGSIPRMPRPCSLQLALAESNWRASPLASPLIEYWESKKSKLVPLGGPSGKAFNWSKGAVYKYEIPVSEEHIKSIKELSAKYRCTPQTIFLQVYLDTLSAWTGMDRFHCALLEADRQHPLRSMLVGFHVAHAIIEHRKCEDDAASRLNRLTSEIKYAKQLLLPQCLDDNQTARRSVNVFFNYVPIPLSMRLPEMPAWGRINHVSSAYMSPVRLVVKSGMCGMVSLMVGEGVGLPDRDQLASRLRAAVGALDGY